MTKWNKAVQIRGRFVRWYDNIQQCNTFFETSKIPSRYIPGEHCACIYEKQKTKFKITVACSATPEEILAWEDYDYVTWLGCLEPGYGGPTVRLGNNDIKNPQRWKQFIELYESGLKMAEIAHILGCTKPNAYLYRKKYLSKEFDRSAFM